MMDYLLTINDVCDIFKLSRKASLAILYANKIYPIDFGVGRSKGKRWLNSQIQDFLLSLSEKTKPKKILHKPKKSSLGLCSMSVKELQKKVSS